jgi:uncharacterized membrane protein YeaQ/YmgE (transglycosylase-associated protein family)
MWGLIVAILIGALAGFIASRIMGKGMGLILCIIVGLIGGLLGSWIFSKLGIAMSEKWWGQLLVGTAGSVVLLFILSLFRRKK